MRKGNIFVLLLSIKYLHGLVYQKEEIRKEKELEEIYSPFCNTVGLNRHRDWIVASGPEPKPTILLGGIHVSFQFPSAISSPLLPPFLKEEQRSKQGIRKYKVRFLRDGDRMQITF